jgi:hypothetical protein
MNHMGVNEEQRITILGGPDGGDFDVDFESSGGPATVAVNETAAGLQTLLEGLSTITVGDVVVEGPDGGPWVVTFVNGRGFSDQELIELVSTSLTGGNNVSVVIEETRAGRAGQVAPVKMPGDLTFGLTELVTTLDSDEVPAPVPTRLILDGGDPVEVPEPPPGAEENTRKFHRGNVFSGRIPFEL